jgi:hypothetical protein
VRQLEGNSSSHCRSLVLVRAIIICCCQIFVPSLVHHSTAPTTPPACHRSPLLQLSYPAPRHLSLVLVAHQLTGTCRRSRTPSSRFRGSWKHFQTISQHKQRISFPKVIRYISLRPIDHCNPHTPHLTTMTASKVWLSCSADTAYRCHTCCVPAFLIVLSTGHVTPDSNPAPSLRRLYAFQSPSSPAL